MTKLASVIALAIALGVPVGSQAVENIQAFDGAARIKRRQKVAIHWQGGAGREASGFVTLDGRSYRLQCAELQAADVAGASGKEIAFYGRAVDETGQLLLVRALDRGLSDRVGVRTVRRLKKRATDHCGAERIPMSPIHTGDFIGFDYEVDLPPWKPPVLQLPGPAQHTRILTYNTAFLYAAAAYPSGVPPLPGCATSCDPIEVPPWPTPCGCDPMTMWPNHHRFANLSEQERAYKMAQRIVETDQDIVVLNEMFHPVARAIFVQTLAQLGPYKHYISQLRGHAPEEGFTLNDIVGMQTGGVIGDILEHLPDFLDYEAVPNPSGLMIFSKYPFLPLQGGAIVNDAQCADPECDYAGMNDNGPLLPGYFAFDVFDACELEDCWASKGVGLVKIDTPVEPSYVAFTHMQADYYGESDTHAGTRAEQFEAIRDLIAGAIPAAEIPGAALYLAGDLNVVGAPRTDAETTLTQEWHRVFDPASSTGNVAGGFFACGNGVDTGGGAQPCMSGVNGPFQMTDAWGFESSPTDLGISNDHDGFRLDYLVHNVGRRCMQHAMIAWDLQADPDGSGGRTWLSDHAPLRGDFGPAATWCSPNDDPDAALPFRNLHDFAFGPTNCATGGANPPCHQDEIVSPPAARIGPAGALQWFRITQPGSYSIDLEPAVPGENVDFVVYHHTDLSRPIAPFDEDEGRYGIAYSMPDPPYYIRTFAVDGAGKRDPEATNREYTLRVHQHLCRSPWDACLLDPGQALASPSAYTWPHTVDLLTELRELWWRFKTSGVNGGRLRAGTGGGIRFPTVQMQMEAGSNESYQCMTQVAPVIERYNDHLFPTVLEETVGFVSTAVDTDADWEDDGFPDDLRLAPDLPGKVDGELQVYFLKITRNSSWLDGFNVCNAGLTSWVSYHTDLSYVVPKKLEMWAELDDDLGAEDNLRVHTGFDASGFTPDPPAGSSVSTSLEQPDSGSTSVGLDGYDAIKGYFVDRAWVSLWETDEEELLVGGASAIPSLSSWLVSTPEQGQPDVFEIYADGPNGDDADFYYYLWYRVCHFEDDPSCKTCPQNDPDCYDQ